MSANQTVLSDVTKKMGSQSSLVKALDNANEYVIGLDRKDGKKSTIQKKEFKVSKKK